MRNILILLILSFTTHAQDMILIRGADGVESYKKGFDDSLELWLSAAKRAQLKTISIDDENSRKALLKTLNESSKETAKPLWIVFIGHGTYLNGQAKLNLNGDDLNASELQKALHPFKREIVFINSASASAPFLSTLSFPGRIIITATKNAKQIYYTKFNEFMAKAIASPEADMNKDNQTSLLESFLTACQQTAAFYTQEKRIQGENALLDDNGDQLGTSAQHYDGLNPIKPSMKIDGFRASQIHLVASSEEAKMDPEKRQLRDSLEKELYQLKLSKSSTKEDDFYQKLETLLRKISEVYK